MEDNFFNLDTFIEKVCSYYTLGLKPEDIPSLMNEVGKEEYLADLSKYGEKVSAAYEILPTLISVVPLFVKRWCRDMFEKLVLNYEDIYEDDEYFEKSIPLSNKEAFQFLTLLNDRTIINAVKDLGVKEEVDIFNMFNIIKDNDYEGYLSEVKGKELSYIRLNKKLRILLNFHDVNNSRSEFTRNLMDTVISDPNIGTGIREQMVVESISSINPYAKELSNLLARADSKEDESEIAYDMINIHGRMIFTILRTDLKEIEDNEKNLGYYDKQLLDLKQRPDYEVIVKYGKYMKVESPSTFIENGPRFCNELAEYLDTLTQKSDTNSTPQKLINQVPDELISIGRPQALINYCTFPDESKTQQAYHLAVSILYDILTGKNSYMGISTSDRILCSKEDFAYLLNDTLGYNEEPNQQPVLKWSDNSKIGSIRGMLRAFGAVDKDYLVEPGGIRIEWAIPLGEEKYMRTFQINKRNLLSDNKKAEDNKFEEWMRRLRKISKLAKEESLKNTTT